ncbi:MAG TPA: endonuclease NucS domain-containing protein [Dehalococcoidia bacterium]|nr:endonuclease NucS domain-containing protein [Dehalococcoidia bacterium]
MAYWEVVRASTMRLTGRQEGEWFTAREIVDEALDAEPTANVGTLNNQLRFHCINDRTKKYDPSLPYLRRPLFVCDDPAMHGKRFRLLTERERQQFLQNPRQDLDSLSYPALMEWFGGREITAPDGVDSESAGDEEVPGVALLELHLQDYLHRHWKSCFPRLSVYQNGRGREFLTSDPGVGQIDFLCTDDDGNFVVIETKRWGTDRKAIGQILSYMGWVKTKLCRDGQSVRGMLVLSESNDTLAMAASAVPGLELWQYEISFKVTPLGQG